jgi:uncharacterized protein
MSDPTLYCRLQMPHELPPDPGEERRARLRSGATFGVAAVFVVLATYLGYVAYEGSRQLTEAPSPTDDCRTPATLGWDYEAVNYDASEDDDVAAEADPTRCAGRGAPAGEAVTGPGGVPIAGWYVPAAGLDPAGPTVVLVHGWGSNKSRMLDRAALLHDRFHLLLVDLRNHGQSGEAPTTQGVREAGDLRAILDWLEATYGPERVAVLGVSMGGATALAEAADDPRVDALVVESTHATLANAARARLDRAGYPLSLPGAWAILLGALLRTGEDVSAADPIQAIGRLDGRPVLLVDAGLDDTIGRDDAATLRDAAVEAGSDVELRVCEAAGHGTAPDACPEAYREWVLGFLDRVLVAP